MLGLQSYGSSSEGESDNEQSQGKEKEKQPDQELPAHLQPVDKTNSLSKSLAVCAAPDVVAMGAAAVARSLDPTLKEVTYNPRYDEMYAPVQGPEHPDMTMQQRAPRNTLAGYVEKAHINAFEFENQRRTFHTYGYALDPTVDATADGQSYVGDLQSAYDDNGKTVFEAPKPKKMRKQEKNDNPEDVEGFLGPWGKFENEISVAKPNEQERAELDELLSKRHKRGRIPEDKPLEEKSTLHSEYSYNVHIKIYSQFLFLLQSRMPTIIRDARICTHHTIWEWICVRMRRHRSVSYPKHTYTPGQDTTKASHPYDGSQRPHIYCSPAPWTAASSCGRSMAIVVVYALFLVTGRLSRILRGTTRAATSCRLHMIVT